jgi:hypothetical protein
MKRPAHRLSLPFKLMLAIVIMGLAVLAFTNPGISDFKGYTKSTGMNSDYQVKTGNYFIFSTYQSGDYSYLGIFKQFILTRSPLGD